MANSIPSFPCLHWEISIMANSIPLNWLMAKSILWLWCIPNLALGLIPHSVYGLVRFPVRSYVENAYMFIVMCAVYICDIPVVIHPHSSMGCCAQFPPDFCLELVASRKYVDTSVVPTLEDDTQHTQIWWGIKMGRIFLCHSWWLKFLFWLPPLYATLLLREPTSACTYNSPHLVIVVEDGLQSKLLI